MTDLIGDVRAKLAAFEPIWLSRPDLKQASVAVCLVADVDRDDELALLITRRAPRLSSHPGQWALPGGRRDDGESIEDAALRELDEETGLALTQDAILGRLDDYPTRSGYVMSPVVVWAPAPPATLVGAETEVAGVYRVPLRVFDVEPRLITIPESDRPVIQLPLFGRYLHAPTAAIIHQFCEVGLHGRPTRVAHFEQPVFAWK